MKPKNIIFIMADEMAAAHVGCYGSGVPSTPTLDALAERGTRFERCYASSPVCTPNRATILSGRSPVINGMISNNFTMTADSPTYAHVLASQGYHVGGFGKFHVCPMPLPHPDDYSYLGFHESVITEDPKWGAYTEWVRQEHPEHFEEALAVAWGTPRMHRPFPDPRYEIEKLNEIRERILVPLRQQNSWHLYYESPLPAEVHQTTYITDLAIDYMQRRVDTGDEQPFFCHVSYVDPHDPYDPPAPYSTMFSPDDMPDPIPATWRETGNSVLEVGRQWLGFEEIANNNAAIRELRAHFHGTLKLIDDQVARIIDFVEENDLWDETVVVFTTDHGDMLGDHELTTKGIKPYDAGIRCPLIVAGGGVRQTETDRLICTLDFYPSFCDWADVPDDVRPPLEGQSFAPFCAGDDDAAKHDSVQVAFGAMETVISDDGWRLTVFDADDAPNQLINLNEDPQEQNNLYDNPAHQAKQTELFEKMMHHQIAVRTLPQYRNLPTVDGMRVTPGGQGNGQLVDPIPLYGDISQTPTW